MTNLILGKSMYNLLITVIFYVRNSMFFAFANCPISMLSVIYMYFIIKSASGDYLDGWNRNRIFSEVKEIFCSSNKQMKPSTCQNHSIIQNRYNKTQIKHKT